MSERIRVHVVHALPARQATVEVMLSAGSTVRDAVDASGLAGRFDGITAGQATTPEYQTALRDQKIRAVGSPKIETPEHQTGAGEHLGHLEKRHPLLLPFSSGRSVESLHEARFGRYLLLKPTPRTSGESADIVLSYESGAPALLDRALGRGHVLLFTSSIDRDWNNLPIQPAFLPLMQQAVRYLAHSPLRDTEPPTLIGQPRFAKMIGTAPGRAASPSASAPQESRQTERPQRRGQYRPAWSARWP